MAGVEDEERGMTGGNRRQWYLLAMLGVSIFAYLRYGGAASGAAGGVDVGALPPIDADGLVRALKGIATVSPLVVRGPRGDSVPDRNLFQYGERKPPPPPPMTEAERRAAEDALRAQEDAARKEKDLAEQNRIEEENRQAQAQQQAQAQALAPPPAPPRPQGPPPKQRPAMNFKFMGVLGPAKRKLGVFLDGDKMVLARKGEILDGKFRVLDIGVEWADIGWVDPDFKDQSMRVEFGP
ncbi:MAG TPA: hypothetical protein VGK94_06070 [Candidatus Polarisedimenticolia bacterium]